MPGPDVYRAPTLPEPPEVPPRELVYTALDRDRHRGVVIGFFQLFSLPVIFGGAISAALTPTLGLVAMVAGGSFSVWHRRRSALREGAVLRVEEGHLHVVARDGRGVRASFRLRDLADVVLDVKTIRRVQDGASPIPAVRFTQTTVGPEVDTARIILVGRGARRRIELSEAYLAHIDAIEWLGKIRMFLRKHGWIPDDERNVTSEGEE